RTGPTSVNWPRAATVVLLVALALRISAALLTQPQLSDDLWRYIHDGRRTAAGVNPYAHAPADAPLATPADMAPMTPLGRDIAQRVNHPHLVTIYQPASQWVFFVFARGGDLLHAAAAEAQATVFRIGFVLLDMAL